MLVMGDGDEEDAGVPNNLLKGLDELPSWRDGFSPHSCRSEERRVGKECRL